MSLQRHIISISSHQKNKPHLSLCVLRNCQFKNSSTFITAMNTGTSTSMKENHEFESSTYYVINLLKKDLRSSKCLLF